METLTVLAFAWALIYAMLFLPTRKAGTWIARPVDGLAGTTLSILCCAVLAWSVVVSVWLALRVGGREIVFPNVKADYFGLSYVGVLLFVPTFIALITGFLHARRLAGRRTLVSRFSARFKNVLANLFALAVTIGLLGFAGRSLLKSHEMGQTALKPMSLIVPLAVVLVTALGIMIAKSSLTKSLKAITRFAVLIVALAVSYYWIRVTS